MKSLAAASALINRKTDYLFIKQNKTDGAHPNTLHLPGGRVEPDESPLDAIRREIEEEVGLRLTDFKVADFDWDVITYHGEPTRFIFLRFTAELIEGDPKPGSDAQEIIWVAKADLVTANLNPPTRRMLVRLKLL